MKKPEEEGGKLVEAGDGLYMAMSKLDTKKSKAVQGRLIRGTLEDMLELSVDESGANIRQAIAAKYLEGLMKNGVTSRDMLALQKLMGEDVAKSQSVKVNVKATAEGKTTEDFLRGIGGGDDKA